MTQYTALPDSKLVADFAAGDNLAFDALLKRHQQKLYNYIFSQLHDADLADDVFQETFVKAITTIKQGRYADTGKFAQWLTRIARNLVVDHFRRTGTDNLVSVDAEPDNDLLNRRDLCDGTIEDTLINVQMTEELQALVADLPDNQREVLNMRIYRDMSFKEIAELTGVSINTALGRMRYALLNLRRMAAERDIVPVF